MILNILVDFFLIEPIGKWLEIVLESLLSIKY